MWRTLFVWAGTAWMQVGELADGCDIAYVAPDDDRAPQARLVLHADRDGWSQATMPSVADDAVERVRRFAAGASTSTYDPLPDSFAILSGGVERAWPRNAHGQVQPAGVMADDAVRLRPIVSVAADRLTAAMRDAGALRRTVPRWPGGKRWAACATHDVDYPQAVRWLEPFRVVGRQGLAGTHAAWQVAIGRRHHWHFASWMALEESIGVRSAFYFAARRGSLAEYALTTPDPFYDIAAPAFAAVVHQLEAAGFEVGLHASYRASESREQLLREKRALETVVGRPVAGNRHHYWRLSPADPDATFADHEAVGLRYDCSLGFERYPGWRRGAALPFRPYVRGLNRGSATVQLPTAWMDAQLFLYLVGDSDARERRNAVLTELLGAAAASGGVFVADMHDYVYDDVLYPGWRETWRWLWLEIAGAGDVWIATPRELADHWREREQALLATSEGLEGAPAGVAPYAH